MQKNITFLSIFAFFFCFFASFSAKYPQFELIIDNALAMQKGVTIGNAMENLNVLIGSTYEQGFIRFNSYYKVYTQAAPEFRKQPSDLLNFFVKNDHGEMVPYSAFMKIKKTQGPNEISRYNLYTSSLINGMPAPGYSSGDALRVIKEVAKESLPKNMLSVLVGMRNGIMIKKAIFHHF
jgi:HAE1 family hydrophobic/amphiphilic exporter-1